MNEPTTSREKGNQRATTHCVCVTVTKTLKRIRYLNVSSPHVSVEGAELHTVSPTLLRELDKKGSEREEFRFPVTPIKANK